MRLMGGERGDTIIEVLFAVTVFALIAIGGLSLMNQGVALAQRALEIGLVRQQIDAQADALRYLSQAYVDDFGKGGPATLKWQQVVEANYVDSAQNFDDIADANDCKVPSGGVKAFALDLNKLDSNPLLAPTNDTATYAQVRHDGSNARAEGIWVQAVRSQLVDAGDGTLRPGYYDFHIRACWHSIGQGRPITLGTIVRLYEPRG